MAYSARYARNLPKDKLGGVIFSCTDRTVKECLRSQLFGLPSQHFSYVRNIEPDLPLFLFNLSERKLLGVYEAASEGKMNIDPYAWTEGGLERTRNPSQVFIRVRLNCEALGEAQFKPIIIENYFDRSNFSFELDHSQARKLISTFSAYAATPGFFKNPHRWVPLERKSNRACEIKPSLVNEFASSCDCIETSTSSYDLNNLIMDTSMQYGKATGPENEDSIYMKFQEMCLSHEYAEENNSGTTIEAESTDDTYLVCDNCDDRMMVTLEENNGESPLGSYDYPAKIAQAETEKEIHEDREPESNNPCTTSDEEGKHEVESPKRFQLNPSQSIYILGGYDGESWLSDLDSFSPSLDSLTSLKPMSMARSYPSIAMFEGELYVLGGCAGSLWHESVESYNVARNEWTPRGLLKEKRGSLAAAALNGILYAVGGGNGVKCFSSVEMFDPDIGRWIFGLSLREKRFALAGAELNGAIYAVGGYDGDTYLKSAERFDPRDHSWARIAKMNTERGCHSLLAMNEKLYALGGYDGKKMVPSVEIFEPRVNAWTVGEPMHHARGYAAAVVLNESVICVIGGVQNEDGDITETIEVYKEGQGWQVTSMSAVGRRAFASAIVLGD